MSYFDKLSNVQKGAIFIAAGTVLLFYALGIFTQAFYTIILIGSLLLILYGLILGDFIPKIKKFIKSFKKQI